MCRRLKLPVALIKQFADAFIGRYVVGQFHRYRPLIDCLWRWRCLRLGFEGLDASAVVGNCLLQVVNLLTLFLDVIIEFRHIQIFLDLRLRLASSFLMAF